MWSWISEHLELVLWAIAVFYAILIVMLIQAIRGDYEDEE